MEDAEKAEDAPKSAGLAAPWHKKIRDAMKVEEPWRKYATRVVQRYRDEDGDAGTGESIRERGTKFNILYANIAVLRPAIFQNAPRPVVGRRYDPQDDGTGQAELIRKASADAATAMERALSYFLDDRDAETEISASVDDSLLPCRGVVRIRYEPTTSEEPAIDPMTGEAAVDPETGEPMTEPRLVDQAVWIEHVYWADFLQAPGRRWSRVEPPPWIAFRHLMTRPMLKRAFKAAKVKDIPLRWTQEEGSGADDKKKLGEADRAEIWEIWDRDSRCVYWVAMGHAEILEKNEDPLGLRDFYPCPRPISPVKTTDTHIPVVEYKQYADLAYELDRITERITKLTERLRAVGVYDGSLTGIEQLMQGEDGKMYPAKNFELLQGRKLEDAIAYMPVGEIIAVIAQLYQQREQTKMMIYEVMGISDILRGQSDPNETLGAQQLKSQFGTLRIDDRRREVNRVLRDGLRIMGELIAEKFEPDILARMTGVNLDEAAMQILRDEGMRGFAIDIESDSTVAPDEQAEQEAVTKLLTAVMQFIEGMTPVVQAGMMTGRQVIQLLRFAIRPFRGARMLEQTLDEAERNLEAMENAGAGAPPGADGGEAEKVKLEVEKLKGQNIQAKGQVDLEKAKIDLVKEVLRGQTAQMQPPMPMA